MFGHDKYNKLGGFYGGAYGYTRFPTFAIPALREMGYEKKPSSSPLQTRQDSSAIPEPNSNPSNKVSTILCDRKS